MAAHAAVFHSARLVALHDAGGGLREVAVDTPSDIVASHTSPGQYVEVRTGAHAGFFVLASDPGALVWELVMRAGGGAADVLLAKAPGAELELTAALGDGFPMAAMRGLPLIVALGGTGVAAGRPILRRRIADGDAARTAVLVGIRTRSELPMRAVLEGWVASKVELFVCLSQDPGTLQGIPHAHGYVQDVLRSAAASEGWSLRFPTLASDGHIFAVGMASMVAALKGIAPEIGITTERVHTNH
jgi:NAD(P)H-flavin reductase